MPVAAPVAPPAGPSSRSCCSSPWPSTSGRGGRCRSGAAPVGEEEKEAGERHERRQCLVRDADRDAEPEINTQTAVDVLVVVVLVILTTATTAAEKSDVLPMSLVVVAVMSVPRGDTVVR